ncbi:MAG: HAD family phosphatase [Clostridiales bacterium]|jgi:putative hydrolase of the HAD superfamily|nr:HAD family phosphatase [Clostridiales bacterium]
MINTIVFDIGNVLADFRWNEYLDDCGYDQETKEKIARATVLSNRWNELDRGLEDEEELFRQCCEAEPSVAQEIMTLFNNISLLVREFDYSTELIKKLKANGYKVYLLSNYARFSYKYAMENFDFIKHVDGGIISYEIQHTKPEPAIYEALINKYNINPKEAVFLDDLAANLEGAKPFGFSTIQVKSMDQALEDLRKLGVRI